MIEAFKPIVLASAIALFFGACAPRGESISVEQSYENAKNRFEIAESAAASSLSPEVKQKVDLLKESLAKFANLTEVTQLQSESKIVAATLKELLPISGYQNRPSIEEIQSQYAQAAGQSEYAGAIDATAKLLAMRTYHILSTELEGTKFNIAPLA